MADSLPSSLASSSQSSSLPDTPNSYDEWGGKRLKRFAVDAGTYGAPPPRSGPGPGRSAVPPLDVHALRESRRLATPQQAVKRPRAPDAQEARASLPEPAPAAPAHTGRAEDLVEEVSDGDSGNPPDASPRAMSEPCAWGWWRREDSGVNFANSLGGAACAGSAAGSSGGAAQSSGGAAAAAASLRYREPAAAQISGGAAAVGSVFGGATQPAEGSGGSILGTDGASIFGGGGSSALISSSGVGVFGGGLVGATAPQISSVGARGAGGICGAPEGTCAASSGGGGEIITFGAGCSPPAAAPPSRAWAPSALEIFASDEEPEAARRVFGFAVGERAEAKWEGGEWLPCRIQSVAPGDPGAEGVPEHLVLEVTAGGRAGQTKFVFLGGALTELQRPKAPAAEPAERAAAEALAERAAAAAAVRTAAEALASEAANDRAAAEALAEPAAAAAAVRTAAEALAAEWAAGAMGAPAPGGDRGGVAAGEGVTEEEWQRRREHRASGVLGVMRTPVYREAVDLVHRGLARRVAFPKLAYDPLQPQQCSKRPWERSLQHWKMRLQFMMDGHRPPQAA